MEQHSITILVAIFKGSRTDNPNTAIVTVIPATSLEAILSISHVMELYCQYCIEFSSVRLPFYSRIRCHFMPLYYQIPIWLCIVNGSTIHRVHIDVYINVTRTVLQTSWDSIKMVIDVFPGDTIMIFVVLYTYSSQFWYAQCNNTTFSREDSFRYNGKSDNQCEISVSVSVP